MEKESSVDYRLHYVSETGKPFEIEGNYTEEYVVWLEKVALNYENQVDDLVFRGDF